MKKLFFGLLITVILIFSTMTIVSAGFFNTDVGDVDCNGKITTKDVLSMRKYLGGVPLGEQYMDMDAADVDGDSKITTKDVLALRKGLGGVISIPEEYGNVNSGHPVGRMSVCGVLLENYKILVPENRNDNIDVFSAKLADYLEQMTGVRLTVTDVDDGSSMIEIRPDTEDVYSLGGEGYLIETLENRVIIHGGVKRGCMYGILDFVENYAGVDFRKSGVKKESWKRVTVEEGIWDLWIPAMEYRCVRISGYSGSLEEYLIPNKTNALESNEMLASARYGHGLGRTYTNAHSFEYLIESCDANHNPCLTDESIYNECVDNVLALIEQRAAWGYNIGEEMNQISCSLNDTPHYCVCTSCKSAAMAEEALAGPLIRFVNRVAAVVDEEYPEIDLFTIAYFDFRVPPKNVCPADNIIICYCWNGCNNHTFGSGECKDESHYDIDYNNNLEEKYFIGWAEKTDRLYCWYYTTSFIYHLAPAPNVYNIYDDFSWLYAHGAVGIFAEGSGNNTFEALKGYLCAKMEENPLMTREEFMDNIYVFLEETYGAGWRYILEYLDMQDEAGNGVGCFVNNYEMPFDTYSRSYMAENYEKMEKLFDNAYEAAETTAQKNAVRKTSVHMYFLCLSATYESDYVNGTPEQRDAWEYDYKYKFYSYAKATGASAGHGTFPATNEITASPTYMWYSDETGSRGNN